MPAVPKQIPPRQMEAPIPDQPAWPIQTDPAPITDRPAAAPAPPRRPRKRQSRSQSGQRSRKPASPSPIRALSPLQKKLLIGVPAAAFVIFIGWKLLGNRGGDNRPLDVSEIQERVHSAPPPTPTVQPVPAPAPESGTSPIDRSSESPEERNLRAEATLGNFFGANKKELLIAYVRNPERVKPLMLDYYSREPFEKHEFLGLKSDLQAAESIGPDFYAAEADIGGPRSQTMILEDTPKGFRVDWEYYVQYNPMNWSTFLKEAPAPAMDFRVYANIAPDYRHPFTDESRYLGVNLMTLNDTSEIMGYAERNSELGKRLEEFLKDKHEELCILRLQFPSGPNPNTVYIRELVNPHWIITDETPSQ